MDTFWSMESQLIQLLYGQKLLSPVYLSLRQKHERPELQKEMVLTVSPFITIPPTGHHKKTAVLKSSSISNQTLCLFLMGRRCRERNLIPARLDIRNRLKQ